MEDLQYIPAFLLTCALVGASMRFGWLFFDSCIEYFADILKRKKCKEDEC